MNLYLTLKALHIISVLFWMAALLYLPRLFVYHTEALGEEESQGQAKHQTFIQMERRLLRAIATPAMIASLVFGLSLIAIAPENIAGGWFHVKALLLFALFAFHGFCARWRRQLESGTAPHSSRFFRLANEIPALLVIIIILLAVTKPF